MENRKKKTQKLVIDGNALYELDIECLERKPKGIPLQSTRNTPIIEPVSYTHLTLPTILRV